MTKFSVYQHWDPLKVCIVGRSYPPEFYSWIKVPHVRSLFERIAIETEEDYQGIIKLLKNFGVEVLRPDLSQAPGVNNQFMHPPMMPRDHTAMIGNIFYFNNHHVFQTTIKEFYSSIKDASWPECNSMEEFELLPKWIRDECYNLHNLEENLKSKKNTDISAIQPYQKIIEYIQQQGNQVKFNTHELINGAMVSRIGHDLYFSAPTSSESPEQIQTMLDKEFCQTRNHVIGTYGHGDGTYCPVCPGLIISLFDIPTYKDTFPDWEVVYLPDQSWHAVQPFLHLRQKNNGRWWIPGFEYDQDVVNVVETWLGHWTGYVEETVFDVNMLIIDPKNVAVFNYNKQVFDALDRFGITPHVVPFRHRYFWDGGVHCVTSDLHREGTMQNFFPERS